MGSPRCSILAIAHCMRPRIQSVRPGPDCWEQTRQQSHQRSNVVLAIIEYVALLLLGERWPLQDAVAHRFLVGHVEAIEPEEVERTPQTAVTIAAVVGVMAKLNQRVDRARWLAPAFCEDGS